MKPKKLTPRQEEEFCELYPVVRDKDLALLFGIHKRSVPIYAKRLNLKKDYPTAKYGNNNKRVIQMSKEGRPIRIYNSTKEASRALGRQYGYVYIREVCRGIRSFAYGYRWKYL